MTKAEIIRYGMVAKLLGYVFEAIHTSKEFRYSISNEYSYGRVLSPHGYEVVVFTRTDNKSFKEMVENPLLALGFFKVRLHMESAYGIKIDHYWEK